MISMVRKQVILIVEATNSDNEDDIEHDLLRNFQIHNSFQINQTFATIKTMGVGNSPPTRNYERKEKSIQ